jgi:hypothetical protein
MVLLFYIFLCLAIAILVSLVFEHRANQQLDSISRSADATADGSQGYPES